MAPNRSKISSHTDFIGDTPVFVASDDGISIPTGEFELIELHAGDHLVPLHGLVNTLGGEGSDKFIATSDTSYAWIDYFNEGDTLNLHAFGFTEKEQIVAVAKGYHKDDVLWCEDDGENSESDPAIGEEWPKEYDFEYTAVTLALPNGGYVIINDMTLAHFKENVEAIVDLTPSQADLP
ncbi:MULTISPECIES: hypothetical protein [unclassified Chelatococcus]|uniref:hypothetical protein n=1 Tax=unclassified Chelatococcus TaxID=2638111 RepID=UPI001BCF648F|nr:MULTISPECIES: hypothetical protein [unclassified Chelatococcus]CAH1649261.1 hypothetical protein CHELA41_20158 [Hyphomicrobiales bacterium]MBS7739584.1 hypothetical protein [Chelatococcus sp. HY11]MBX3543953.1 hypothetical protein [Chelatococcus sp.]MCO5075879.1 hypothetical protein [Chelatococcus sp.]CAH1667477.1 hypothetical protein CHELA20_50213 [Hyphomicrobiales bacterium]